MATFFFSHVFLSHCSLSSPLLLSKRNMLTSFKREMIMLICTKLGTFSKDSTTWYAFLYLHNDHHDETQERKGSDMDLYLPTSSFVFNLLSPVPHMHSVMSNSVHMFTLQLSIESAFLSATVPWWLTFFLLIITFSHSFFFFHFFSLSLSHFVVLGRL